MSNFRLFLIIFLFLLLCYRPSYANSLCGDVPIFLGQYSIPEILFVVDLSGSMALGFRPDWSPSYDKDKLYSGFFTDQGLDKFVFNRVFRSDYRTYVYFDVYACSRDISHLTDPFLNNICYRNLTNISSLDNVCIDEILSTYGIADWSFHGKYSNNCLDYPPYFSTRSPSLYENDSVVLGNYLNTMRVQVVGNVIKDLVQDSSISTGIAFFNDYFGKNNNYTLVTEGIKAYDSVHISNILSSIDNICHESIPNCNHCYRIHVGGATPFWPAIIAAKNYFLGLKSDQNGNYYSSSPCAKKFVIFLTDGIGNRDPQGRWFLWPGNYYTQGVIDATKELISAGVTPIAVGFNLSNGEDVQLREIAKIANQYADGVTTFALHKDLDGDGVPDPFIARNPEELVNTLRNIIYSIKQTVYNAGSSAARKSNLGNFIIFTNFDAKDWTGELKRGSFKFCCADCHSPDDVRNLARNNFYKDLDHDGHLDLIDEDRDGDGHLDTVYEDVNNNHRLDPGEDKDGDGHLDVPEDLDGDNHLDKTEPIDWDRLSSFLRDVSKIRQVMGDRAVINYSSSYIDDIIKILKGDEPDNKWWDIVYGWSTNSTLSCNNTVNRNIKYESNGQLFDFLGVVPPLSSDQVSFIRGERGCGYDNQFRIRQKPLGAIIFSQPKLWGNLVWIGADDGMLHAFNIDTGNEEIAIIPNEMLQRYIDYNYFSPGYCHKYLLDGTPVINQIYNKVLLFQTFGHGGDEIFALDITNAPNNVQFLWKFIDPNLGKTINPPKLTRCENGWTLFVPSGYALDSQNWNDKKAYLFSLNPLNGALNSYIVLGQNGGNMITTPVPVDWNNDHITDSLYLGDYRGHLWKINGCSMNSYCVLLDLGINHPITAPPVVSTFGSNAWVFLGTGKYGDINDINDLNNQFLIGFLDYRNNCSFPRLVDRTFTIAGDYKIFDSSCNEVTGWKVTLSSGERVITSPIILGNVVFFLTFKPSSDQCSGSGTTWLYALPFNKGCLGPNDMPIIDVNGDGVIDNNDLVNNKPPVAIKIGQGVPNSSPVSLSSDLLVVTTTDSRRNLLIRVKNVWIKVNSWTDIDVPIN